MDTASELQATVKAMAQPGKGLLAADESGPTIAKRFATIGVESNEENRRAGAACCCLRQGWGRISAA